MPSASEDLKAEIGEATSDMEEKKAIRAKKLQAKKTAEADLAETQTVVEADKKYLADVTATCEMKASEFATRQKIRAEEILVLAGDRNHLQPRGERGRRRAPALADAEEGRRSGAAPR